MFECYNIYIYISVSNQQIMLENALIPNCVHLVDVNFTGNIIFKYHAPNGILLKQTTDPMNTGILCDFLM